MKLLLAIILAATIAACAPTGLEIQTSTQEREEVQTPQKAMGSEFLYLAALDAINHGKVGLAIRFLETLVEKDPQAKEPRLQLAELLLLKTRFPEAEKHVRTILSDELLEKEIKIRALMLHARVFSAQGKLEDSLGKIHLLLQKQPDLLQARVLQIRLLSQMGKVDEAHAAIKETLKSTPHPEILRLQAQLYLRQEKVVKAQQSIEALLKASPHDERAVLMLSNMAVAQGNIAKAEAVLRAFIQGHPRAFAATNSLGQLLVQQKRVDEAIEVYKELAFNTGEPSEVLTSLGLLYYQKEDFSEAATTFRKALAKQDSSSSIRFYLAASLEALGKAEEAAELYRNFDPKEQEYSKTQLRLASIELSQNKMKRAIKRLTVLIDRYPKLAEAHIMLSSVRLQQKKFKLLLQESEQALGLEEIPADLLLNRAIAYEKLHDYVGAETNLRRLLTIEPDNAEALNFLGYLFAERGIQLDEAEKLIRRALKQRPKDPYYLDSLAWVYFQRQEYAKALELQQKALEELSDDPVMFEHLGDMLWKTGDIEAARRAWNKAITTGHKKADKLREKISTGL
ncbi:MAG: tetratricopeptide repeat protein [Mariprofundaceae bacterium]